MGQRLEGLKVKVGKITEAKHELENKIGSIGSNNKVIRKKAGRRILMGIILALIGAIVIIGAYIILEIPGLPWKPEYSSEYAIGFLFFLVLLVVLGKIVDKLVSKSLNKVLSPK